MKILVVHNFYQQAGGEDGVFAEECALLEKSGHTVGRFTMDNDSVAGMGKLELAKKTIWNRESQELLKNAVKQIEAEVVHFHNTFPLVSPACYYAAHEAGAAVVQTIHNYRLLCPTATFYRDGHVCEDCLGKSIPYPGVIHKCYRDNRAASAAVAAMLTFHRVKGTWQNEVDRYIALTQFAREKLVAGGLPAEKIIVKPNFVDPDPGVGAGHGSFALFVGRLTDEKGVNTLINAWPALYASHGLILRIAGDGPLRDAVTLAAQNCAGIEYLGRRPPAEIYSMMGDATALVFPSQWYEGLPRTIIESFAKGTPVVASRLGSMTELVDHERTGLLFEAGNAGQLSVAMQRLMIGDLASPTSRVAIRAAARARFESQYTAAQNLPMLLECYRHAVAAIR